MHFETRGADEKARAAEHVLFVVLAKDVANILAKETFNTLAEFLHAVHIALIKLPRRASSRLECRNLFIDLVVPGNVGNQVFNDRKGFHRIYDYGLI